MPLSTVGARCRRLLLLDLQMKDLALGMMVVGALWAVPSAANACSCFGSTVVSQSEGLPENAAVMFQEFCGGGGTVAVQVDGMPAQLVSGAHAEAFPLGNFAWVEPAPAIGQTVTISVESEFEEETKTVVLVVEEADETPPSLSAPTVAVTNGPDPVCNEEGSAYLVEVSFTDDAFDGATTYALEVFLDGASEGTSTFANGPLGGTLLMGQLVGSQGGEICVEVSAIDAAGNLDQPDRTCVLTGDEGCACSTGGGSAWAMLPVLLLGAGLRRRR